MAENARMSRPSREDQDELLDRTLSVFQPRTQRRLAREDAREIVQNLTGFFRVLPEWDRRAQAGPPVGVAPAPDSTT